MKRFALFLACVLPLAAGSDDSFLLRNVTVHPVSQPDIANGSVLVENGKIMAVGSKLAPPKGIRVIDGKGLHVYPGMINSATEVGLSEVGAERVSVDTGEIGEFNPQLKALSAVNPSSEHIPVTRANGITSVITLPGQAGGRGGGAGSVISGQAAMIHLDGWTWEEMQVKKSAAVEMIFPVIQGGGRGGFGGFGRGGGGPTSYTQAKRAYDEKLKQVHEFFTEVRRYQTAKSAHGPGFVTNLKYEAMLPVLEGKTPMLVAASHERAIQAAIDFADEEHIKIIVANPRELGKTAAAMKAKNIPVIAGPTLALPQEEDDPYDSAFTLPVDLYKAGVKFAFGTFDVQFARNLPYQAAASVAFGLPYQEALKSVTLNPAQIWGLGDQLGSIDEGKWADLMVTDGDPLEARTNIKQLYIKGKPVDLSTKHTRLYEKYMNRQ